MTPEQIEQMKADMKIPLGQCLSTDARRFELLPDLEAEVLRLREALNAVVKSKHSDICSYILTCGKETCDCHVSIARAALKGDSYE